VRGLAWSEGGPVGSRAMLLYHLRLAVQGLRRDRGLTVPALVGLALAASLWSTVAFIYLRVHAGAGAPSRALHQVEIAHRDPASGADPAVESPGAAVTTRTRVSVQEYELLAGSGLGLRQAASFRAQVAVSAGGDARLAEVRFVTGDFFALFGVRPGEGRFFSADEETHGDPVAVLARPLAARLFPRAVSNGTVLVDGRPFRVVGQTGEDQPFRPAWDAAAAGEPRDELYLPLPWAERLRARPEHAVLPGVASLPFEALMRSPAVFVTFWIELPTATSRAAYATHLERALGRRRIAYRLRSYDEWRAALPLSAPDVDFFVMLTAVALAASGLNMARLLLARGLLRRDEVGIHRALGASRRAIFGREVLAALALAVPAALAGPVLAVPYLLWYNHAVSDRIVATRFSPMALALSIVPTLCVGALAALYPAWQAARIRPTVSLGVR
jgi:putative ABC transport system permease protein